MTPERGGVDVVEWTWKERVGAAWTTARLWTSKPHQALLGGNALDLVWLDDMDSNFYGIHSWSHWDVSWEVRWGLQL